MHWRLEHVNIRINFLLLCKLATHSCEANLVNHFTRELFQVLSSQSQRFVRWRCCQGLGVVLALLHEAIADSVVLARTQLFSDKLHLFVSSGWHELLVELSTSDRVVDLLVKILDGSTTRQVRRRFVQPPPN